MFSSHNFIISGGKDFVREKNKRPVLLKEEDRHIEHKVSANIKGRGGAGHAHSVGNAPPLL